jgi:hypothetical protein
MLALPCFPSLAAVTLALPAPTAVTVPDDETVTTDLSLEIQLILRPLSVVPEASSSFTLNVLVPPTSRVADDGVTVTLATGGSATTIAAESF